jgi:hypothetical protein
MTVMLFPDPRMRSPTALGAFGLLYACDDLRAALNEMEALLVQAKAAKLLTTHWFSADEGHPIAVNAQAVYSQVNNQNTVVLGVEDSCSQTAGELRRAAAPLRELLAYNQTGQVGFTPPADSPYQDTTPDTLDKLKPLFISVGVIAGVVVLAPIVYELIASVKMFRKTKARTSGYRRRR